MRSAIKRGQIAYTDTRGRVRLANYGEADVLWLSRAVEAEGREYRQVAQTLVNLWALCHSKTPRLTLTRLVRAYAQPVNPRWYLSGDLYQKWHAIDPVEHRPAKAVARENVHSRLQAFSSFTVEAVDRALTRGPLDIPVNCTDYAAAWIDASRKYVALTEPKKGVNRLWTRRKCWKGYRVP